MPPWVVYVIVLTIFTPSLQEKSTQESEPRFSVVTSGQEVTDLLVGFVWNKVSSGKEFVGDSTPDLYSNRVKNEFPIVETSYGSVKGIVTSTSRDKKVYSAFMGIPFAKPPIGSHRFKGPEKPEPWEGILDGTREKSTCLTFLEPNKGSEDCLYLNIFTPGTKNEPSSDLKPVMVFIYGGAFMGGSSNTSGYAPDFLIDKDVVVVTFNYRIGPLGFLSLQNELAPGNAGLKDQTMALTWVQQNINSFGGDKSKVTIFGESAGAASVNYHLISPASAGLFQRAIMESGSALASWAYTDPHTALEKAFTLGRRVGCAFPTMQNQTEALYKCLLDSPGPFLIRMQVTGLSIKELFSLRPLVFVPTAEPAFPGAFITRSPLHYLSSGTINKVPVITGINTAEGLLFYGLMKKIDPTETFFIRALGEDLTTLVPPDLPIASQKRSEINVMLKKFYTRRRGSTQAVTPLEFLQVVSDTQFLLPMLRTADLIQRHSQQSVYTYLFSYDGPYACFKVGDDFKNVSGTAHMDELGYIFNLGPLKKAYHHSRRSSPEERVIDVITSLWTEFATTGNPTTTTKLWKEFRKGDANYYEINTIPKGNKNVEDETVTFWNDIYEAIGGNRILPQ